MKIEKLKELSCSNLMKKTRKLRQTREKRKKRNVESFEFLILLTLPFCSSRVIIITQHKEFTNETEKSDVENE